MLKKGDQAPIFSLNQINGEILSLDDYKGRWVIVYFYPKDNTPGCTKQAIEFTELYDQFQELGVDIIGINSDSIESHQSFVKKNNLQVILLSDTDKKVLKEYKVWGEKKFMDKVYEGLIRSTFIINPEGIITEAMYNIKATGHGARVLKIFKKILDSKK